MNWDVTKRTATDITASYPLTIAGVKEKKVGNWDCYSIEVEENITYWKKIRSETVTKKELVTFQSTFESREKSDSQNNVFYYLAYHYRKKIKAKIPLKGHWFNEDMFTATEAAETVFCVSEEANEIIKEEKARWDKAGLTEKKDLKLENLALVNAKLEALEKDANKNDWNPPLNEAEKNLIKAARTIEEVSGAQNQITLQRNKQDQEDKIANLKGRLAKVEQDLKNERERPNNNLNEIIEQAKNAKSIDELRTAINSLSFYRNSQVEAIRQLYMQREGEINQLLSLLPAKLQANKDIGKTLGGYSFSREDIIPAYQDYAETIRKFTEEPQVEKFAQDMIAYLGRQNAAYQALRKALKTAQDLSDSSQDQQAGIFEKRRQARQSLDKLSEDTSPEANQAYQVMNKSNEVTNSINKLYGLIENHLARYKEKVKQKIEKIKEENPSKKEFLEALKEGTPKFDLYYTVWGISERYVKDKLGKELNIVYPYTTGSNGTTSWDGKEFDLYYNFDSINSISLDKDFDKAEVMLLSTVSHELSHTKTFKEEESSLKNRTPQYHSEYFWKSFLHRSPADKTEPTAAYVYSCLPPEKRKKLKDYVFDPSVPSYSQIRYRYFPDADYSAIKIKENERKKKKFDKDQADIADIWEDIWTRLFKLVDSSISEPWSKEKIEKHWIKAWLKQPHETKQGEEKEEKGFRAYIYYKNDMPENLKNLIDTEFSSKNGWDWKIIDEKKIKEISEYVCANIECGTCEEKSQQVAQIIHNPPPHGNGNK